MVQFIQQCSLWSYDASPGAQNTINVVIENGDITELEEFINDYFDNCGYIPTDQELDDFLKYDSDYILESLGIDLDSEEEDLNDE